MSARNSEESPNAESPSTTPLGRSSSTARRIIPIASSGLVRNSISSGMRASARRALSLGPALGQIQFEIDWQMLRLGRDAEADGELAVGDFTDGAGVLTLHTDPNGCLASSSPCRRQPTL